MLDGNFITHQDNIIKEPLVDFGTTTDQIYAVHLPVLDAGGLFTATNVEDVLAEIQTEVNLSTTSYVRRDGTLAMTGTFDLNGNSINTGNNVLVQVELDQLATIGTTTISANQWVYVGTADQAVKISDSPAFAGLTLNGNINSVTTTELSQLETINATTITTTQWVYMGTADQAVKISDSPTFNVLNTSTGINSVLNAELSQLETLGATIISAAQWTILGGLDASLTATELNYVDGVTSPIQSQINTITSDLNGFPDELKNLTTAEIQQLENINATTITTTQWIYIGEADQALKQADSPTFNVLNTSTGINSVLNAELSQLETLGATIISAVQWGYIGVLDQNLRQADSPTFEGLTLNGNINSVTTTELSQLETLNATTISAAQWDYLGELDQNITTTSNVTFNDLLISGSLKVIGDTTTLEVETVVIEDPVIVLNHGESGAGVTLGEAGLNVDRGSSTTAGLIWNEPTDEWQAGLLGAYQALATRPAVGNLTDNGVAYWDSSSGWFETATNFLWDGSNLYLNGTFKFNAGATVGTIGTTFVDNDTSLMTSAAIDNQIISYSYVTGAGAITAVEGEATLVHSGSISLGGHAVDDIDITSESSDANDHLMTALAVKNRIEDYSYMTAAGAVSAVEAAGLTFDAAQTLKFDAGATVGTIGTTFVDNDTSLMTSQAIKEKIEDYGYSTEVGTITAVTGTAPVVSSGGTTPAISMAAATNSVNGYATLSHITAIEANTLASHAAVTLGTASGLSLSTQELSLILASTSTTGALSSTDWNTFNGKQAALTFGIANSNAVQITVADVASGEYARFNATGVESRTIGEIKIDLSLTATDVGLGNVDNIADANQTALGTVVSGNIDTIANYITQRGIDDTPVDGQTVESISSNWAFDHQNNPTDINHLTDTQVSTLHTIYTLESHDNTYHSTNYAPIANPTFTDTVTMPDTSTWTSSGVTLASTKTFTLGGNAVDDIFISSDGASSADDTLVTAGWVAANSLTNPMSVELVVNDISSAAANHLDLDTPSGYNINFKTNGVNNAYIDENGLTMATDKLINGVGRLNFGDDGVAMCDMFINNTTMVAFSNKISGATAFQFLNTAESGYLTVYTGTLEAAGPIKSNGLQVANYSGGSVFLGATGSNNTYVQTAGNTYLYGGGATRVTISSTRLLMAGEVEATSLDINGAANISSTLVCGSNLYCVEAYNGSIISPYRDVYVSSVGEFGYISSTKENKDNIEQLQDVEYIILGINAVNFIYKNATLLEWGWIAEEIEPYLPESVWYKTIFDEDKKPIGTDISCIEGFQSKHMVPILWKQVQKLTIENNKKTEQIKKLEERLSKIEKYIESLP